jgi:hypothetical protein
VAEVGFNTTDKTTKEAFETIAILPDNFAKGLIGGLTEFRNYPIQTQPPIKTNATEDQSLEVDQKSFLLFNIVFVLFGTCIGLLVLYLLMRCFQPSEERPIVRTIKRRRK